MKIVELNPFYFPYSGGIERRIAAITRRLSPRHEFTVITSQLPGTPASDQLYGARVIRLPSRFIGSYNPPFVRSEGVLNAIREESPDIVDYHYRWSHSYNSAFFSYRGVKIVTFHNQVGEGTGLLGIMSYLNDMHYIRRMKHLPLSVTISEFVRRQLISRGLEKERVIRCYNGIEKHGCPRKDAGYALFVGRMVATKGIDILCSAAIRAGVPLKVAGTGPLFPSLKRRFGGKDIEFLGHVNEEEKDRLLAECSFFVMPSLQESFGIAVLEAMSHGKAIVASAAGGLPEVVGDCGLLFPPRRIYALESSMRQMWIDADKRHQLGVRAENRAALFTWDRTASEMEAVYSRALSDARM